MRKTPPFDADRPGPPSEPAAEPTPAGVPQASDEREADAADAPSLVWPPADDEMREWEVLQLHSSGSTIIEPLQYTPPAPAAGPARALDHQAPVPVPSTPSAYVPPPPIDDPVGEASLVTPPTGDFDLPETELIEPLHSPTLATMPMPKVPVSGARPAAVGPAPVGGDDRTIVIPRPSSLTPPAPKAPEPVEDNQATRILVAPNFAASLGHAPTVPVSALHRAAVPPRPEPVRPESSPTGEIRRPMEDTLPAGMTRELLARTLEGEAATYVQPSSAPDTHPMAAIPAGRPPIAPVPLGPVPVPGPFSRVPSRQPAAAPSPESGARPAAAPPPIAPVPPRADAAQTPTTPRLTPPGAAAGPAFGPPYAPPAASTFGAPVPQRVAAPSTRRQLTWLALGVAALLAIGIGVYQYLSMRETAAAAPLPATLSVDSTPAGATVLVDGAARGRTPLRLELTEGAHTLEVAAGGTTRKIPLALVAGTVTAHTIEFAGAVAPAAAADAAIEIRSEPQGGRVLVDGAPRGTTPIVVTGLTAGRHEVQVVGPHRTQTKTVTLAPKQQLRLVMASSRADVPATPGTTGAPESTRPSRASADTGFINIQSPIVLRVVRNGDFVGTSEDGKLSLPAGPQIIGLENESVGFRDVRTVEVLAGKVTPVAVTLPNGAVSINARPWAEVFVDGQRIGETPVSQFSVPVGMHEITFRHPDHDERKVTVLVKIGATGRAFTDFTK